MTGLDEPTLERLYVRLERPLYNVVYRWVWEAQEAQDIVQEAFVRLWNMRGRVRPETVEPLVWRIALNQAHKRRRWRRLRSFFGLDGLLATEPSADEALGARRTDARVRRAVERLPDDLREVVFLCAFSELSYAEVGRILDLPEGTVASRRNRALGLLRADLEVAGG